MTAIKPFPITSKTVLHLAVPMTLAYLSTPLLGLVDTAVVGRFGDAALIGGLAVGAIIIDLVFTTFNFLRWGTSGLVSQAYGAGNEQEKQAILVRALLIAIVCGIILALASPVILKAGLWFIDPGNAVAAATSTYFLIRILATPFALGNYAILGWLLGIGRSGTTLAVQLLLNGSNIFLSIFLGLYLEWGVKGVAIATVIAELLAFLIGCLICFQLADRRSRPSGAHLFAKGAWIRLTNLNGDIMIRSFSLFFAFAFFTAQGAGFGEVTLAANAILMHFFLTSGYFLDGLATAAEQIVGRSVGANYRQGFWRGFRLTLVWSFALAFACSLVFWLAGTAVINMLTVNTEVRELAEVYLPWAALIPLAGVLAFHMDGVFIGATWSRDMSVMMILSLLIYIAFWQLVQEPLGNHGLWLALYVFLLARGLTLALRVNKRVAMTFVEIKS